MPVQVCSRCQRVNPEAAVFCYFDGMLLRAGGDGAQAGMLAREFIFPSGRRCRTYDDFALGCQEEWVSARDLLRQGIFQQFFGIVGRADLAMVAQEAMTQADCDIGLTTFLGSLPVSRTYQPRLDIHPRRLVLGKLLVGEVRQAQLTIGNQGQGQLQGSCKISEGAEWLTIPAHGSSCPISTAKEQKITLVVNTEKLVALQNHMGRITFITNGGVVEVPVGMDLVAQPFAKAPYQGVKTPREMAERMRAQAKAAVPLLESGEVARWFASNNWNFPVAGPAIKGVAGVQQFFEAMGLSKPPPLQLSQSEVRFRCNGADPIRFQVTLSTTARKWVYALVESDAFWLKVLTPEVSGPQRATISFEVIGASLPGTALSEARLSILANAGQKMPVLVIVESDNPWARSGPAPFSGPADPQTGSVAVVRARSRTMGMNKGWLAPLVAMAFLFFLVRLALVPLTDFLIPGDAVRSAAARLNVTMAPDSPLKQAGGWLMLPWSKILLGSAGSIPTELFAAPEGVGLSEFRHYLAQYFIRAVVLWTWWLGPILGLVLVRRRGGGVWDWPCGLVAGVVAGIVGGATLASVFLVVDAVPHLVWDLLFAGKPWLVPWIIVACACWALLGALAGLLCSLTGDRGRVLLTPARGVLVGICRLFRLRRLEQFFAG